RQDGRVGLGEDAVADVEDVAGPAAGALEDVEGGRLRPLPRAEEDGGVEVPLHRAARADGEPAPVERDTPVEADRVASRRRHRLEQMGGAGAEVDRRNANRAEQP